MLKSQPFREYLQQEIPTLKDKLKPCDIFKTSDGKKAVEIILQLNNHEILQEILEVESSCHKQSKDSIACFRRVVKTDGRSAKAVEILDSIYEQSWASKNIMPLFVVAPLLLRLVNIVWDQASDIQLALNYYAKRECTSNCNYTTNGTNFCFKNDMGANSYSPYVFAANKTDSLLEKRLSSDDYNFAWCYTIFSIVMMLLFNLPMTFIKIKRWMGMDKMEMDKKQKRWLYVPIGIIALILSPIVIILSGLEMVWIKAKIARDRDKKKKAMRQDELWDLQLEFGTYETIEAAEATLQLLLQLWLLGANYDYYYKTGILKLLKEAVLGSLFMFDPNTSIEQKTLGKFFVSFISIVISASSMYRRTKREAIQTMSGTLLMMSIVSQIIVHIACFAPLYFVERHFLSLVLPICIHYFLIAILKSLFDPTHNLAKESNKILWTLNVAGSTIINVNLIPRTGYKMEQSIKDKAL